MTVLPIAEPLGTGVWRLDGFQHSSETGVGELLWRSGLRAWTATHEQIPSIATHGGSDAPH